MLHPRSLFRRTALAASLALAVSAGFAQEVSVADAEAGRLWFVELSSNPVLEGGSLSALQAEQANFRAAARAAGVSFSERMAFATLFNGLSLELSAADRAKLAQLPGVKAVYPVDIIQAPQPQPVESASPDMVAAIHLSGAAAAQNTLGLTGAGVKVAIIDSGVDIDHPAFGGSGVRGTTPFPNSRFYAGYDFVGDNFDGNANRTPAPDSDPRDCAAQGTNAAGASASGGHGTHVAGIIGANGGGVLGVAPQAKLAAYRVFGCYGSTSADILLAAMERAVLDGAQVINQSIGARAQWPQYPTSQAASRLARKGIVMVASIGNNGPGGSTPDALFAAGAPGVGDNVIGVASFDNAQRSFSVNGTPYGYTQATASPTAPTTGNFVLARTPTVTLPPTTQTTPPTPGGIEGCPAAGDYAGATWQGGTTYAAGSLAGKVLVVRRGTCGFHAKAWNAQQAGAAGVIIYNNTTGAVGATVAGTPAINIPVVGITQAQGTTLSNLVGAGTVAMDWTGGYVGFPYGTGGLISSFSSYGLTAELGFKPDLGAPGGGILSTAPLELGGTMTLSGTSMSSPHVAGAAALVLQAVPGAALGRASTSPLITRNTPPDATMLTRLMNTSKPKAWSGNPGSGLLDSTFRQGAGMIDIVAAATTKQFVVPAKISAGESDAGPTVKRLTVRNDAAVPVTYALGHEAGVATTGNVRTTSTAWTIGGSFNAPATVSFSAPTVTVPAKGMATVDVTIAANAGLVNQGMYGGYITLTPQGGGATSLIVPYAGFKGDYQSIQVLNPGTNGFPWLATQNGSSYTRCAAPAGCSYTMATAATRPYVLYHLAHYARYLKLEALDHGTGQSKGVIAEGDYLSRSASPGNFFTLSWNGTTTEGVQPNGVYRFRLSVLKAQGDANNAAHWETWDSLPVIVARPN